MEAKLSENPVVALPKVTPTLRTERLTLEPLDLKHAPGIQKHVNDWEIVRYLNAVVPWPYPPDGAETFIRMTEPKRRSGESFAWAITLSGGDGEALGAISVQREKEKWTRGFWLSRQYQGKGYMTEAVNAVTDFVFSEGIVDKLIIPTYVGNTASLKIKEKMPGRPIARQPIPNPRPGSGFTEELVWEITREDWMNRAKGMSR